MDIEKLNLGGEWLELEAIDERVGKLKFKVRSSSTKEQLMYAKALIENREKILDEMTSLVVDWDLTKGDEPLPCTDENKAIYMPHLIGVETKGEGPEDQRSVGSQIILFSNNLGNFVKK